MTMMASGRLWQIARCLGARPGILLQMMLAPRATTEEKPLEGTQIQRVRPGGRLWVAGAGGGNLISDTTVDLPQSHGAGEGGCLREGRPEG